MQGNFYRRINKNCDRSRTCLKQYCKAELEREKDRAWNSCEDCRLKKNTEQLYERSMTQVSEVQSPQ